MQNFIKKNGILVLLTLLAFAATKWDAAYSMIGTVLYAPLVVGMASLLYRLVIQLRFSATVDAYSRADGSAISKEKQDWDAMLPRDRAIIAAILRAAFFIGTAILVAAVVGR